MSLPPIQPAGSEAVPPPPTPGVAAPVQNPWAINAPSTNKFEREKFFLNQKVLSLGNKYTMFDEAGGVLFTIDRPVLKLKAHIGVFEDESKTRKLLSIDQERFLAINMKFSVKDEAGNVIGVMERAGWMSMLRRTWEIRDANGTPLALAQEDSWGKAIARRVLASTDRAIIAAMIRTNFIITRFGSTEVIGEFIRRMTITDKYIMDMTKDPQRTFDRRLAVALAIVLDNAEAR
jgi:uncharacterized protein YxjI